MVNKHYFRCYIDIVNNITFFIRFPGPRSLFPRPFHPYPVNHNHVTSVKDRNAYRHSNNQQRSEIQSYGQQRQIFPILQQIRHGQADTTNNQHNDLGSQYNDNTGYYNNKAKQCHVNSMGDIDHWQASSHQNREFNKQPSPWVKSPAFLEGNQNKPYKYYNKEQNKVSLFDYTGHRPPSSDHYGGNLGSTNDNSKTFRRSVDDTVDIVRKRLQRRGSHHALDNESPPVDQTEEVQVRETTLSSYSNVQSQPEQPVKKKMNKTRNVKSNCDKIKTKIVHQLFKMDKDKIHKLMDNPNSSTKFEYAISSLITESQNSYNRHLRSVAEKSLCRSSSEFIHNDNNTIYEDTFMKQMQCILDPQDTILLEDIKPMVLAELSKVLQLDDFEHRQEYEEQSNFFPSMGEQSHYSQYSTNESYNYENYQNEPYPPTDHSSYYDRKPSLLECPRSETPNASDRHMDYCDDQVDSEHLFERRESRSRNRSRSRRSSSSSRSRRKDRRSTDGKSNEDKYRNSGTPPPDEYRRITTPAPNEYKTCSSPISSNNEYRNGTPVPLFDTNDEQFSEAEDPFAELDNQYHVAVDHNFIDNDDLISQSQIPSIATTSPIVNKEISATIHNVKKSKNPVETACKVRNAFQIEKEIDTQLHDIAKSPLKFSTRCEEPRKSTEVITQESATCADFNSKQVVHSDEKTDEENQESVPDFRYDERNTDKGKSSTSRKSSTPSRKRSIEEKPSHRKEKRKKSESEQMHSETNKQILNKNIIINVNDCAAKSTIEKYDTPKSIFNLYFSKEKCGTNSSKENKKMDSPDKNSDKHIKRKDERNSRKSKDKDSDRKKHDSISSTHSAVSPTETSCANSSVQTPTKADSKLKPIDMFIDHPKKASMHHSHRNTAPVPIANTAIVEIIKPGLPTIRKITKKHVSTQVIPKSLQKETQTIETKRSTSRFCQTERKRLMTRGMQTEPESFRSISNTADAFERMKEIDMEIQALLQEKFKLYSSLESKEGCPSNTMQSLGMAVLNVAPVNDNYLNDDAEEDAIVDDFTNIPVEELEEIAFETVQEVSDNAHERRSVRHKVLRRKRKSSLSPATTSSKNTRSKRKANPPNISLIEQIITDDRPLEDIISLDCLEVLPSKPSKSKAKSKSKPNKKCAKKVATSTKTDDYTIKECSVVLVRADLGSMLKSIIEVNKLSGIDEVDVTSNIKKPATELALNAQEIVKAVEQEHVDEETDVSDIQFDMLDVSEDIVIGDSCEVKSSEKDENYTSICSVNEEIILDNSQQSIEEAACTEIEDKSHECKVYDFLSDENLQRDSIAVSGNADSVLAIEVSFHKVSFLFPINTLLTQS